MDISYNSDYYVKGDTFLHIINIQSVFNFVEYPLPSPSKLHFGLFRLNKSVPCLGYDFHNRTASLIIFHRRHFMNHLIQFLILI